MQRGGSCPCGVHSLTQTRRRALIMPIEIQMPTSSMTACWRIVALGKGGLHSTGTISVPKYLEPDSSMKTICEPPTGSVWLCAEREICRQRNSGQWFGGRTRIWAYADIPRLGDSLCPADPRELRCKEEKMVAVRLSLHLRQTPEENHCSSTLGKIFRMPNREGISKFRRTGLFRR